MAKILRDVDVNSLREWDRNPRKNGTAVKKLIKLIQKFGYIDPIVVDQNMTIRAGHTRIKALKALKYKTVPVVIQVDFANEDEAAEYAIADNKSQEWASWDTTELEKLLKEFKSKNIDTLALGFKKLEFGGDYTKKIKIPQYTLKGEKPSLKELVNTEKYDELVSEIERSNLPKAEKKFLKIAATRFYEFTFSKIAEYYAGSSKEMQEMMERLALVIIDFDDAIANGFVRLSKTIEEIRQEQEE